MNRFHQANNPERKKTYQKARSWKKLQPFEKSKNGHFPVWKLNQIMIQYSMDTDTSQNSLMTIKYLSILCYDPEGGYAG